LGNSSHSRLPELKRLVAKYPHPLSIAYVIDRDVRIEFALRVIAIIATEIIFFISIAGTNFRGSG